MLKKCGLFVIGLYSAFFFISAGRGGTVESDPSIVPMLPRNYPLNRVRVDARQYPWSAVGRVTLYDSVRRPGGRSSCTGTLIAEQLVLTAAHCVWSRRHFPAEVGFLAGLQQAGYVAHSKAKDIHFSAAYQGGKPSLRKWSVDWALIELEKPLGKTAGYIGWAAFDPVVFKGLNNDRLRFKVSGYRGDRLFVQTVDHQCNVDGFTADNKLMFHGCPIMGGDSGGGVFLPFEGELLLVGIDVGVIGKPDHLLQRGEKRRGFAIPTSNFRHRLIELGIDNGAIRGSAQLVGRLGRAPSAARGSMQ